MISTRAYGRIDITARISYNCNREFKEVLPMDPFFFFLAFTVLSPATNHAAVLYYNSTHPDLNELNISLNQRESRERAKYMANLLKKMGAKEGTAAAENGLLDNMLRYDGLETNTEKKS